jgi:uncharacterized protein
VPVDRLVMFVSLALGASTSAAQSSWNPLPGGQSYTIRSEALGELRDVFVLPPRATTQTTTPYQVMVLLDGDGLLPVAAGLTSLLQLGAGHQPWLLVAVRSVTPDDRVRNFTPAPDSAVRARYPSAGGSERFRRFLASELRPFVAERYRTGDRWGLVGHSLGGVFVVQTLASVDTTFSDFIAISPTLGWQGGIVASTAPARLQTRAGAARLFLSTADEGPRYPPDATRALDAALTREGPARVTWTLRHFAGEDHVTTVPPALHAALRWLSTAR